MSNSVSPKPSSFSSFEPQSQQALLDGLGWPRMRGADLGKISWTSAGADDFTVRTGSVLRENRIVSIALSESDFDGHKTILKAVFVPEPLLVPKEPATWIAAFAQGANGVSIDPKEAVELFRHWVDGQAKLPAFAPLGRAESLPQASPPAAEPALSGAPNLAPRSPR